MKVKTYEQLMAQPDLEIYRLAIQYLVRGVELFSCMAIQRAVNETANRLFYLDRIQLHDRYIGQYRSYCKRGGTPHWWSGPYTDRNKAKRIKALKLMIAACERAGRKDAA